MSFQNGFNMGQRAYQQSIDNRRQAELDERRKVMEGRQDADYARMQGLQRGEDTAFQTYNDLQANGVINAQGTGLSGPSANLLYGKAGGYGGGTGAIQEAAGDYQREMGRFAQAPNAPQGGLPMYNGAAPVSQRGASELEIEQALGGVATARRDTAGMRASMTNAKKIKGDNETRDFITSTQGLYERANSADATDDDRQAWMKAATPYTKMISGFSGLAFDARVNPKTGALEQIPYDGGKVQPVSFEQAMPYLLASKRLVSQYGDVDRALDALNGMSDKERARVLEDSKGRFDRGAKFSESAQRGLQITETGRHNQVMEADSRARTAAANRGQAVQLVNDKGEAAMFYLNKVNAKTGMVELPAGYRFPNQKPGTEVVKAGDTGAFTVVNARTKAPLFVVGADGVRAPAAKDPWTDQKIRDQSGAQGIGRRLAEDDETGALVYRYIDLKNPDSLPLDSPEEVLQARQRSQTQVQQRRGEPSASAGGLPLPTGQSPSAASRMRIPAAAVGGYDLQRLTQNDFR